jgi:hypothetical protein
LVQVALPLAVPLLLSGCVSSGPVERYRERETWISGEEVKETGQDDLYEITRQLRPRWFTGQNVLVFQNRSPLGGLDALRSMNPEGVFGVEWMGLFRAAEELPAVGFRGREDPDGVIVVWTRPPRD